MMRFMLATLAVAVAATTAMPVEAREDTRRLTCAQVNALVQQRGQIVMNTGPNTFQRFVANRGFCDRDQFTMADFVPSADNPNCPVEWICMRRPQPNR